MSFLFQNESNSTTDTLMKFTFKKVFVLICIILFLIFGGFEVAFVIIMIIIAFATGQTFI